MPDGATVEVARDGKTVARVGPDAGKGSGELLPLWKPPEPVPEGQSPFDRLDPKEIPAAERFAWQPRELVGLIGTHARRHWGCIPGAAISDDGTKAATVGSKENTTCLEEVIIWDLATQSPLRRFVLSPGDIAERLQFAEKDTRLYLFGHPSIQLWDIAADPPKHVPIPDPPRYVARYSGWFLEGGKTFCACDHDRSGDIALFALDGKGNPDGERRKISKIGHYWSVSCVAPSADLVVYPAPDSTLRLARVKDAKFADEETLPIKLLPNDYPRGLSPDGKELVVADAKGLAFWDIAARPPVERRRIPSASLPGAYHRVVFSPCSRWLVTRGDNGSVIWRADGPQPRRVAVLDANDAYIGDAAFSRDGNTLVTGNQPGLVRFWDLRGAEPKELSPFDPATAFARIDAHLTVVCFARQSAEVMLPRFDLDPATKKPRWQTWALDSPKPRPTPGPEVFLIEPADNATRFWPVAGRKWLESPGWRSRQARLHAIVDGRWQQIGDPFGAPVLPGLVTPDGKLLVSLAGDGSVSLEGWNVSGTPSKKWTVPHPAKRNEWPNRVIAASHDGSRFAVITYPSAGATDLTIWRNSGSKPELQATLSLPQCWAHWYIAAMSPDGRLLAHSQATNTGEPEVLDLTGKEPRTIGRLPKVLGVIHWLEYAPNGRRLAAAGDRGVAVFDAKTLQLVWKWATSPGAVYWLDWAADGRHLVTHNGNKTVYVLRLTEPDR